MLFNYNHQIVATGTETGAFVRLDDLESGYAYREIDRAIFLNPDQTNARVVLPVSNYSFISKNHPVDLFLYANNYDDTKGDFSIFKNINDALDVFKEGKRKAKGTTAEIGLVKSFFANPFGPVQQREDTEKLINQCFTEMFNQQIDIGILYTKLAVFGKENDGPKSASKALLSYLLETKRRN